MLKKTTYNMNVCSSVVNVFRVQFGWGFSSLQVLQFLLDDVSSFLSTRALAAEGNIDAKEKVGGCDNVLKAFLDHICERERENFRSRRHDNENSITLTTIHQVLFSDIISNH